MGVRKFPILGNLVILLGCLVGRGECVAAASEWPLGLPEEYTMAMINVTYKGKNGTVITEKSQSGRFGKGGKIGAMAGVIHHVKSAGKNGSINHFGCDQIINDIPPGEKWIALVKRGQCDFDLKLEQVLARNGVGMVVYDRETSDLLEDMKLSSYSIPGIFTFKSKGERWANLSDAGIRLEMYVTIGEICTRPYTGVNRSTSVLFVSISFIVLMAISLAWLAFYYVQRFRYLHAKDRLARRLCTAAKKALAKIPTRSVKPSSEDLSSEPECCAVCIDFYKTGDTLRTLPCRHEFHKMCVDPWLLEHRTCPMCKMDILKHYGYIFTGSQESILHLDEDATLGGESPSDSRDDTGDEGNGGEEGQVHTHHQHHRIHHHPQTDLPSPTTATQGETTEYQLQDEVITRKPSLISLTVTASANGCVTTSTCPSPRPLTPSLLKASMVKDSIVTSLAGECDESQAKHPMTASSPDKSD